MPVLFDDWIKSPISIINNIFESDPVNFETKIQDYFDAKLKNEKDYLSIPCLNDVPTHEIAPNSLVRYRCMIQDQFDPVFFTSVQKLKHKTTNQTCLMTLKYKESIDIPDGYEILNDLNGQNQESMIMSNDQQLSSNGNDNNLLQRTTFFCVPIPGETEWVKSVFKSKNNSFINHKPTTLTSSNKRSNEIEDEEMTSESNNQSTDIQQPFDHMKIVCKEQDEDTTVCKICFKMKTKIQNGTETKETEQTKTINFKKKSKHESETSEKEINLESFNLTSNFPLSSNETRHACLVKVYDNFDNFKLNDTVEFVGIFSQDPSLAYMFDEHKDYLELEHAEKMTEYKFHKEDKTETADHQCKCSEMDICITKLTTHSKKVILSEYPPSLVPRLHCIKSFYLTSNNPLLSNNLIDNNETSELKNQYWSNEYRLFLQSLLVNANHTIPTNDQALFECSQIYLNKIRNEIINAFQEFLLGDTLAAEYLLMHLISSVFLRKDVTVLGKFALNITNVPKNLSDKLYTALEKFLPMSHMFQLTIDNLNKMNLIPSKDYNKDKLISGMLQLPDQFQLVIDETCLDAGELKQKGLINLNSIKEIIKWQKMNYDFSFHQQEFNTNLKVLVLSEGKSLLPFDVQLKLSHTLENFNIENYQLMIENILNEFNKRNLIDKIRKYFTIMTHLDYKLNENMQQLVENDIVQIRQTPLEKGMDKMSFEDFHLLLVVARLQTLSYGKYELSVDEWNRAKSLEFERLKKRIV